MDGNPTIMSNEIIKPGLTKLSPASHTKLWSTYQNAHLVNKVNQGTEDVSFGTVFPGATTLSAKDTTTYFSRCFEIRQQRKSSSHIIPHIPGKKKAVKS